MINADSISLITGLSPSAAKTEHASFVHGEEQSLAHFDQVLIETSESIAPPMTQNLLTVEGKIESHVQDNPLQLLVENPETGDILTQLSMDGQKRSLLRDGEEKQAIEAQSELMMPTLPGLSEQINTAPNGTGTMLMASSSEIKSSAEMEEALLQKPGGMMSQFDSGEEAKAVFPDRVESVPTQTDNAKVIRNPEARNIEPPVALDSEKVSQRGTTQTPLIDSDGKGERLVRALPSSEAGAGPDGRGREDQFRGKEGDDIAPVFRDQPSSDEFPEMIKLDSDTRFSRFVAEKASGLENTSPDSRSVEKLLLRQVAEKIQLWRPHEGDVIRFRLEPETLGMLQVDISIHEKGIVADIIAEHHFVKTLLEQNQNMLHETLSAKGMGVDRFSVNVGTPEHQGADRKNTRQVLEIPRTFSEQEETLSHLGTNQVIQSGDYRINLYI